MIGGVCDGCTPISNTLHVNYTEPELHKTTVIQIASLEKCDYTVGMGVDLKLTNGQHQPSNVWDWMTFRKK